MESVVDLFGWVGYYNELLTTDYQQVQIFILKILRTISIPTICSVSAVIIR